MLLRVSSGLFCALFLVGAAVQYNDPDPLRWIGMYVAAALVSAVVALGHHVPIVWPATVGGVALVWGIALALGVEGLDVYASMFDAWEMTSVRVEEAREASGLVIIAAWMGVVVWRARFWGKPRR